MRIEPWRGNPRRPEEGAVRSVPAPRKRRRAPVGHVVLLGVVLSLLLMAWTWMGVESVRIGYERAQLERQLDELTRRRALLLEHRARLLRYERVARQARDKLGLRPAREDQVVLLAGSSPAASVSRRER